MDRILGAMRAECEAQIEALQYIQNFDFDSATEEEIVKFQEFVQEKTKRNQQMQNSLKELRTKLRAANAPAPQ
jgi:hypothetical protein